MKTGNDATDKVMRKTLLKYLFLLFLQVLFPVALHSQFRPGAFDNLTDSETVRALKGHVGTIASTMMEGRAGRGETCRRVCHRGLPQLWHRRAQRR